MDEMVFPSTKAADSCARLQGRHCPDNAGESGMKRTLQLGNRIAILGILKSDTLNVAGYLFHGRQFIGVELFEQFDYL